MDALHVVNSRYAASQKRLISHSSRRVGHVVKALSGNPVLLAIAKFSVSRNVRRLQIYTCSIPYRVLRPATIRRSATSKGRAVPMSQTNRIQTLPTG
jgi:hypothetical protein